MLTVVIFQGAALYTYGGRDGCELVPKNETFSQWKNLKVLAAFLLGLNRSFPGILALKLDSSYHHDFTACKRLLIEKYFVEQINLIFTHCLPSEMAKWYANLWSNGVIPPHRLVNLPD